MPTKLLYHSLSSGGQGGRKQDGKELMGHDKGSLIKQKQRPCAEAKENKRPILYFISR